MEFYVLLRVLELSYEYTFVRLSDGCGSGGNNFWFHGLSGGSHSDGFGALGEGTFGLSDERGNGWSGGLGCSSLDGSNEGGSFRLGHAEGQFGLGYPKLFGGGDRTRKADVSSLGGDGLVGGGKLLADGGDLALVNATDGGRFGEGLGSGTRSAEGHTVVGVDTRVDHGLEDTGVLANLGIRNCQNTIGCLLGNGCGIGRLDLGVNERNKLLGQGIKIADGVEDRVGCGTKVGQLAFEGGSEDETVRSHGGLWKGNQSGGGNGTGGEACSDIGHGWLLFRAECSSRDEESGGKCELHGDDRVDVKLGLFGYRIFYNMSSTDDLFLIALIAFDAFYW